MKDRFHRQDWHDDKKFVIYPIYLAGEADPLILFSVINTGNLVKKQIKSIVDYGEQKNNKNNFRFPV